MAMHPLPMDFALAKLFAGLPYFRHKSELEYAKMNF